MSFMKMRQLPARTGFGDNAKRATTANRGGRMQIIPGRFNNFYPREDKALWIAICPMQEWTYDMYNRDSGEVETFEKQFWYGFTEHYIASIKRRFVCSAGADKSKPCWGCGVINHFWDHVREQERETGVRTDRKPALSRIPQFMMSIVLLEEITKVQAKDGNGVVKKNREGKPIVNDVPLSLLDLKDQKAARAQGNTSFGLSMHWTNGIDAINQLMAIDRELINVCGNCAGDLKCTHMACPECTNGIQVAENEDEPLTGEDLLQAREAAYECECGYTGTLFPITICDCGEPEDGRLASFALRVKVEKSSETKRILKVVEVKPLQHYVDKYPVVEKMLMEPLDIKGICAPMNLEGQLRLIPENLRGDGVSALPKQKEAPATEYEFSPSKNKRAVGQSSDDAGDDDVPF